MMNKTFMMIAGLTGLLLCGCSSNKTTIYTPGETSSGIRSAYTISNDEFRQMAQSAAKDALNNARFKAFVRQYQRENGDNPDVFPIVKLDQLRNETYDNDLNTVELTSILFQALLNSDSDTAIEVTMAEGAGRTSAIAESRDLAYDDNFDQSTVAQKGTLQAARLVLRPTIRTSMIQDDSRRDVVNTFVLEMADIKTGRIVWMYTKQFGFIQEKGSFGW